MGSDQDGLPVVSVAPQLWPARAFDTASRLVIDHLLRVEPMGMWAVTRIVDGRQIMLTIEAPSYEVTPGDEFPFSVSLCGPMVAGRSPQIAPDTSAVPAYAALTATAPIPVGAYVGTPIVRPDGSLFGTLCAFDPDRRSSRLLALQPLLDLFSSLLSAVLEADTAVTVAQRDVEAARRESDTDALTGLLNRRGWDRYLRIEEERFRRFGDTACVIVLDLDNLKSVNDTSGHAAGDRYIREAARALAAITQPGMVLARLGGDEFGMIVAGLSADRAGALVLRLEQALEQAGVSGSFGHAPYSVVSGFPGAWEAADAAMYAEKQQRRHSART